MFNTTLDAELRLILKQFFKGIPSPVRYVYVMGHVCCLADAICCRITASMHTTYLHAWQADQISDSKTECMLECLVHKVRLLSTVCDCHNTCCKPARNQLHHLFG